MSSRRFLQTRSRGTRKTLRTAGGSTKSAACELDHARRPAVSSGQLWASGSTPGRSVLGRQSGVTARWATRAHSARDGDGGAKGTAPALSYPATARSDVKVLPTHAAGPNSSSIMPSACSVHPRSVDPLHRPTSAPMLAAAGTLAPLGPGSVVQIWCGSRQSRNWREKWWRSGWGHPSERPVVATRPFTSADQASGPWIDVDCTAVRVW